MGGCDGPCSGCCGQFFVWLCRFWGLATAIAIWGIGVEASFYGHYLGYFMIFVAVLLTFLEAVFAIDYCVVLCASDELSSCRRIWDYVLWLDDYKKGVFYFFLSIPCFIQPAVVWMGIIAGVMLVLSAMLYVCKTLKTNVDRERIKLSQNPSYDKFDDIQEELDDEDDMNVITHHGTITIMSDESVGDQQEILEV